MWSTFVEGLASVLTQLAAWLDGSYGMAVIAMALLVRLAMLPMTLKAAEQGWWRQQQLVALKPKLAQLRDKHAGDPTAQAHAIQHLYREQGITASCWSRWYRRRWVRVSMRRFARVSPVRARSFGYRDWRGRMRGWH